MTSPDPVVDAAYVSPRMTAAEHAAAVDELARLRDRRDRTLRERGREARAFVSADAAEEIAQLRSEQAVTGRRIEALEQLLSEAVVVQGETGTGVVALGSTVEVRYEGTGLHKRYQVVGAVAASDGTSVSARSPIGAVLLGRRAGEVVGAALPGGRTERLTILSVS
ncbi:MAG TPA: GreA/GreB family elongation factor [Baekduia sp.]|uniref:GreA/GreB family elongation factor n=1 Tax=Baekduia sp. TaxID=2600305 RepID=UPI002D787549|nr:GreA/GreB family elongation factor [Baekduia sp.]HET6505392.1 GreA/GreB family elongation factor [Baekduia sp.]